MSVLHAADDLSIAGVRCQTPDPGWSAEEEIPRFAVVLVRSGRFRRFVDGRDVLIDPTMAYVDYPGSIQRVGHPCGGDACTNLEVAPGLLGSMADPERAPSLPCHVGPDVVLAHWLLVARALHGAGAFELAERSVVLVGRLLRSAAERVDPPTSPTALSRVRRLVDDIRQSLGARPDQGLGDLAMAFGVDAFQLSRAFRTETGLTLSAYRRRLRVSLTLERLAAGEQSLAGLAAEAGFADQAHMTRTLRRETDLTPGQLRRLLAEAS